MPRSHPVRERFSNVSHPRYSHHTSEPGLFTGVEWDRIKEPAKWMRNSISPDQFAVAKMGGDTRYRNLVMGHFFTGMQQVRENDKTLFDHTTILSASNLGNASAHTCENLPVLLAGAGFKHQGHILKDRTNNAPLSNLSVRVLQNLGIQTTTFRTSTGVLNDI